MKNWSALCMDFEIKALHSQTASSGSLYSFILKQGYNEPEIRDSAWFCFMRGGGMPFRGFTQMQKRMLPDQYNKFLWKLIPHFGRNPYYERRNGKRTLPPVEQELIADVAQQVGVTEEFKFDRYEYRYNWKD